MKKVMSQWAIVLVCLLNFTALAQETQSQYASRLKSIAAEEQKIERYIQSNISKGLPSAKVKEFDEGLNTLEVIPTDEDKKKLYAAFEYHYWRGQYFLINPRADIIFHPWVVASSCSNGGFENGTFSDYTGETAYGSVNGYQAQECDILSAAMLPGNVINFTPNDMSFDGDFAIVLSSTDPNVPISTVNTGSYAARINSDQNDTNSNRPEYSASKLIKRVVLSEDDEEIFFSFASVMEDPGNSHTDEKPTFLARVTTTDGVECDRLCHSANSSDPFLLVGPTLSNHGKPIRYNPWSCGSLNACGLAGDTVILEFVSTDCGQGLHWGYTYVDDICDTCSTPQDSCNFQGSVQLDPTNICDGNTLQGTGTIAYAVSNCKTAKIDSIVVTILQSGVDVTQGTVPVSVTGSTFTYTISPANLPVGVSSGDGFDIYVKVYFSFGGGMFHEENDYHTNPGPNNDYVYNAECCPEFNVLTCCDLATGAYRMTPTVEKYVKAYREKIAKKYPNRKAKSGDPCCNYCDYPGESFPIFIYDENGILIDNSVYGITWSHQPANNSAISSTFPDSMAIVTVKGPGSCVWTDTFYIECCKNPGINGVCCDSVTFNLDVDSLCSFDPCKYPDTQFPVYVKRDGATIGTPAYSFSWSNGSTGSATSVSLNQLPISVAVTDNATGCSGSITYDINCVDSCTLVAPTNLKCVQNRTQHLSWSAVPNAVSYQIMINYNDRKCCGTTNPGLGQIITVTSPSYSMSSGSCFSWRVRAVCADGSFSPWSYTECSCAPILSCFITSPTNLKCQLLKAGGQQLSWSPVLNAVSYEISITNGDPDCCSSTVRPTTVNKSLFGTSYTVSSSTSCFSWKVRARCQDGTFSSWTSPKCSCGFRVIGPVIGGPIRSVRAVPNPASSYVDVFVEAEKVSGDMPSQAIITIADMSGQEMLKTSLELNQQNRLDLQKMKPGVYIYQVFYDNGIIKSDKIVIQ